ncbi:hypothetical protein K7H92_15495 [Pseudomonas stutzeri]|nr:hypothetical protein [Stutzerimonas stutzeri]
MTVEVVKFPLPPKSRKPYDDGNDNGDPPGGGGMEARVAKLENHFEYIRRDLDDVKLDVREIKKDMREDFRIMFGALVVVALGLAGMMAKGFGWL